MPRSIFRRDARVNAIVSCASIEEYVALSASKAMPRATQTFLKHGFDGATPCLSLGCDAVTRLRFEKRVRCIFVGGEAAREHGSLFRI